MMERTKDFLSGGVIGCFITICVTVILMAGREQRQCDLAPLAKMIGEVSAKCETLAAQRCLNVTTPVLNVSVYDVPKIQRAPVPKG